MEKIIEVSSPVKSYEIYGTFNEEETGYPTLNEVEVYEIHKVKTIKKLTKIKNKTAELLAAQSIAAFINDDEILDFFYVNEKIEEFKNKNQTYQLLGIHTPDKFYTKDGRTTHLIAYSDEYNYYTDNEGNEDYFITTKDNTVITSLENFFITGIVQEYKENRLIIIDNKFSKEKILNWIKQYIN